MEQEVRLVPGLPSTERWPLRGRGDWRSLDSARQPGIRSLLRSIIFPAASCKNCKNSQADRINLTNPHVRGPQQRSHILTSQSFDRFRRSGRELVDCNTRDLPNSRNYRNYAVATRDLTRSRMRWRVRSTKASLSARQLSSSTPAAKWPVTSAAAMRATYSPMRK